MQQYVCKIKNLETAVNHYLPHLNPSLAYLISIDLEDIHQTQAVENRDQSDRDGARIGIGADEPHLLLGGYFMFHHFGLLL
jgi:hypothetical protein